MLYPPLGPHPVVLAAPSVITAGSLPTCLYRHLGKGPRGSTIKAEKALRADCPPADHLSTAGTGTLAPPARPMATGTGTACARRPACMRACGWLNSICASPTSFDPSPPLFPSEVSGACASDGQLALQMQQQARGPGVHGPRSSGRCRGAAVP